MKKISLVSILCICALSAASFTACSQPDTTEESSIPPSLIDNSISDSSISDNSAADNSGAESQPADNSAAESSVAAAEAGEPDVSEPTQSSDVSGTDVSETSQTSAASETESSLDTAGETFKVRDTVIAGPLLKVSYYDIIDNEKSYVYTTKQMGGGLDFTLYVKGNNAKLTHQEDDVKFIILHTADGKSYTLNDITQIGYDIPENEYPTVKSIVDCLEYTNLQYIGSKTTEQGGLKCQMESYKSTKDGEEKTINFYFDSGTLFLVEEGNKQMTVDIRASNISSQVFSLDGYQIYPASALPKNKQISH